MIKTYYRLTKPGIIYGNAIVAAAGYFFAAKGQIDLKLFFAMLVGLSFVIASSCVLNNVYDRDIDAKMERTKKRAIPQGIISQNYAIIYATILGLAGASILKLYTNQLTLAVALLGFLVYVCLYTPLKLRSPVALFVGAVAGAVPPVVGYVAVTNNLDWYAAALFAFVYIWQIPHFLAIATYRYSEYTAAGVPLYIKREPSMLAKKRGKKVFGYSLIVLLFFCALITIKGFI